MRHGQAHHDVGNRAVVLPAVIVQPRGKRPAELEKKVQTLLKVEILKRNLTYRQVSGKLAEIGAAESEPNIRNKLARGTFSAVFLVQCLEAIGVKELRLE
jgi:Domain of unknown function (DUF6471)